MFFFMGYGGMYLGFEFSVFVLVSFLFLMFWYRFVCCVVVGRFELSMKEFLFFFMFFKFCCGGICGVIMVGIFGESLGGVFMVVSFGDLVMFGKDDCMMVGIVGW